VRFHDPRRNSPRISVDGVCGVASDRDASTAAMLDLSSMGLRLERAFDPARATRSLQLEIELPSIDEVMWAHGEVTFAHLSPMGGRHENGQPRMWCRAGIRIASAARRDLHLLRDYVFETGRARQRAAEAARRETLLAMLA
jgi:hypothetical protein